VWEGILWILRSGARWQDLPEKYPHPSTCWRRVRDWEEQGVWLNIWREFLGELNERQQLKWSESFLGGSFAPAKKGAPESEKPSGERNEVDGGGRRPGCSFGILPSLLPSIKIPRPDRGIFHDCFLLRSSHNRYPEFTPVRFVIPREVKLLRFSFSEIHHDKQESASTQAADKIIARVFASPGQCSPSSPRSPRASGPMILCPGHTIKISYLGTRRSSGHNFRNLPR
jgi:hypothetical protein